MYLWILEGYVAAVAEHEVGVVKEHDRVDWVPKWSFVGLRPAWSLNHATTVALGG